MEGLIYEKNIPTIGSKAKTEAWFLKALQYCKRTARPQAPKKKRQEAAHASLIMRGEDGVARQIDSDRVAQRLFLKRGNKLKSPIEIRQLLRSRSRLQEHGFSIRWIKRTANPRGEIFQSVRFAIVISKKSISSAVRRNRMKRLVREFFRLNQRGFSSSVDIIVQVNEDKPLKYEELEKLLGRILKRTGVFV